MILVKALGLNNLVAGAILISVAFILVYNKKEVDEKLEAKNE